MRNSYRCVPSGGHGAVYPGCPPMFNPKSIFLLLKSAFVEPCEICVMSVGMLYSTQCTTAKSRRLGDGASQSIAVKAYDLVRSGGLAHRMCGDRPWPLHENSTGISCWFWKLSLVTRIVF